MKRSMFSVTVGLAAILVTSGVAWAQAPDMSIEVIGAACNTDTGPTSCNVEVGTQFTVRVNLDSLGSTSAYTAFQARLNNSAGLTYQDRPGTGEIVWPDCVLDVEDLSGLPTSYRGACALLFGTSTFTGGMMEADYLCPAGPSVETVTMVHGQPFDTHIIDDGSNPVIPNGSGPSETLTINCIEPPLDHYKCYKVKDLKNPKFDKIKDPGISLDDQFGVEADVDVIKPFFVCNPADKNGSGIIRPDAHLCCYKIKAQKLSKPRPQVEIEDQFGTHELEAIKPQILCQPCSKTLLP